MEKKRHHYVPQAYLKFFARPDGKLFIHLKDEPDKVIEQIPDGTAFHKYFYSQPLPGGGRDNNTLEDFFAKVEDKWPPLVERLQRREQINLTHLYEFVSLQRARVPAVRDAAEMMQAEVVRATALTMKATGKIPPPPADLPQDLLETAVISIDPHQSIHAMADFIRGMGPVFDRLGLGVVHNTTKIPFITSDNPVVYFDPRSTEDDMLPYTIDRNGGPIAFQFPVTPSILLYGYSQIRAPFRQFGLRHADIDDVQKIAIFNDLTARFAYRAVFSQAAGAEALVKKHAANSPVVKSVLVPQGRGHLVVSQNIFGARLKKPKWEGPGGKETD